MVPLLRLLRPLVLSLAGWAAALPAAAQEEYEALLQALAQAPDRAEAEAIVPKIWAHWLTAPDAAAQEVLDAAMDRRAAYDYLGALVHLNKLVATHPAYAEAWNQRATIHFLIGDYAASLQDVEQVLAREPRHFGALAGRAVIYYRQGRLALAQLAVREALKHHPYLAEAAILDIPAGEDI